MPVGDSEFRHWFHLVAGAMSVEIDPFDLDAAGLRQAQTDLKAFSEALAVRLEGALPERVGVDRRRDGVLARTSHVSEIVVHGDQCDYRLRFDKGHVVATRAKAVRGVVIGTSELTLAQWLSEVRAEVAALAGAMTSASDALHDFL